MYIARSCEFGFSQDTSFVTTPHPKLQKYDYIYNMKTLDNNKTTEIWLHIQHENTDNTKRRGRFFNKDKYM